MMMSWTGIKFVCLVSQLTMIKIVSNLENSRNFLIKSIEIELYSCLGLFRNMKLFKRSVELITLQLRSHTSNTGIVVHQHRGYVRNICGKLIVVFCFDQSVWQGYDHDYNTCVKITSRQYIDSVVKKEKTIWVHRLSDICRNVFCSNQVTRES